MTLLRDPDERLSEGGEPDKLEIGEIFVRKNEHAKNESGHRFEKKLVSVGDVSTAEGRERMRSELLIQDQMLKDHPEWPAPTRKVPFTPNPVSDIFYENYKESSSMWFWRDHEVPNAEALYPLQRLNDAGRRFPNKEVDDHAMDVFINHPDSVAIRARGIIHTDILSKRAAMTAHQTLKAIALGAGAGVPNIDATIAAKEEYGTRITWDMYDIWYNSLQMAKELAVEDGIPEDDITTHRADYRKAFKEETESVDVVDMLGLWEYLDRDECIDAVRESYRLLKSGGVFVASNMLLSREFLDFNQRGVQWPTVVPRSVDDLVDIVHDARIDTESLTITLSEDGVYAVMEIHKP